jgi:xanthine dehydrogenase accessory factor
MSPADALRGRAEELRSGRTPFVLATVVRAEKPASARPGDRALVLADGTIEGFVGGECAESTTRAESLRVLSSGEAGLLRITPGSGSVDSPPGIRTVDNPCLSGGALEIFLEPVLPPALVVVVGDAPVAQALVRVGAALDHEVRVLDPGDERIRNSPELQPDVAGVVVASHGRGEPAVLAAALRAGVPYVALVASRTRGAAVLAALDVPDELRARVHSPAGLDLGGGTAAEIALSILAELVKERRAAARAPVAAPEPDTAVDPVCGMTVAAVPASVHLDTADGVRWFCCPGCRDTYAADPARYAAAG